MNEDYATRGWAEHHGELSQGIANAARAIMESLKVMQEKRFAAPWREPAVCRNTAKC